MDQFLSNAAQSFVAGALFPLGAVDIIDVAGVPWFVAKGNTDWGELIRATFLGYDGQIRIISLFSFSSARIFLRLSNMVSANWD